jgi:hypothetical protein
MYYGARLYDPSICTFISADTIVLSPGHFVNSLFMSYLHTDHVGGTVIETGINGV